MRPHPRSDDTPENQRSSTRPHGRQVLGIPADVCTITCTRMAKRQRRDPASTAIVTGMSSHGTSMDCVDIAAEFDYTAVRTFARRTDARASTGSWHSNRCSGVARVQCVMQPAHTPQPELESSACTNERRRPVGVFYQSNTGLRSLHHNDGSTVVYCLAV